MLILLGVFFPTFSRQIMDAILASAILVTAVIWLVEYLAWRRPRDPEVLARREALQQLQLAGIRAAATAVSTPSATEAPPGPATSPDPGQSAAPDNKSKHDGETGPTSNKGGNQNA
jgi:hypothetical protein